MLVRLHPQRLVQGRYLSPATVTGDSVLPAVASESSLTTSSIAGGDPLYCEVIVRSEDSRATGSEPAPVAPVPVQPALEPAINRSRSQSIPGH